MNADKEYVQLSRSLQMVALYSNKLLIRDMFNWHVWPEMFSKIWLYNTDEVISYLLCLINFCFKKHKPVLK
jgi:hypothetical protein